MKTSCRVKIFLARIMYLLFTLFIVDFDAYASSSKSIEQLKQEIVKSTNDSLKVLLQIELSQHNLLSSENSIKIKQEALQLSKKINSHYLQAICFQSLGNYYLNAKSDFNSSLVNFLEAIKVCDKHNFTNLKGKVFIGLAGLYLKKEDFATAEKYYLQGIEIKEIENDPNELGDAYNNFGNFYNDIADYPNALRYYQKSLAIRLKQNDTLSIAVCYDNIANAYSARGAASNTNSDFALAENYYKKALSAFLTLNDKLELAICYLNLSEFYFEKSELFNSVSDKNIALENCLKGLELSKEIGFKEGEAAAYGNLSQIYENSNQPDLALAYYKRHKQVSDSINSLESNKHIAELQMRYDVDKKDNEITILNKDKKIQASELNRQKIVRNSFIGGFILVVIFSFFLYRNYTEKKKVNMQLSIAKSLIEDKNKNITDSINYAQRIQQAILPLEQGLTDYLPESFILFKPKDIVSGDFYWFNSTASSASKSEPDTLIIAAADCTGHGVPGAFMSVIGTNLLNEIVKINGLSQPGNILTQLNEHVRIALKQNQPGTQTNDGMDVCLCAINKSEKVIEYAGANRPLYVFRNRAGSYNFEEIKSSKFPVGGSQYNLEDLVYKNHQLHIENGDTFYLFSDGFCDQFGGPNDKKFMSKKFRELLQQIQPMSMKEQEKILRNSIEEWMGSQEQSDDILVIGIRL